VTSRRITAVILAAALSAAVGCDDDPNDPGPDYPPQGAIVSGDLQQDTVGDELPGALVVRVTDQDGDPIAGQAVTFTVTAGGGTLFAATAQTSAAGEASNRWTLGTVAGDTQRVEARIVDPESGQPVVLGVFRAVGLPDAPATITARPPATRTGSAGQALADSLEAQVKDQHGNGVPGTTVVWLVTAGGGTLSPGTTTTGANGITRAQWTLGRQIGTQQTAEASLSPAVRAQFAATAGVPVGAVLVKVSGDGQSGTVGSALAQPVVVELRTSLGEPIAGGAVSFTPAAGSGTATPPVVTTGADGRASTTWTLGTTPGAQALMASADGVSPVSFSATANAGAAASFTIAGGDGQTAPPRSTLPQPLSVRVADAFGNPLAGVTITWAVTDGGGSIAPTTSQTDASGVAQTQWTLGPSFLAHTATATMAGGATLTFSATPQVGPVDRIEVTPATAAFTALGQTQQFTATPLDAYGNTVSGVTITWTSVDPSVAAVSSTGLVTAARNGSTQIRASGGGKVGMAEVTVQQVPAAVAIGGGTAVIQADTLQLTATVRDARGNIIPGATVTWSTSAPGVATVTQTGVVTAAGSGNAMITATAANGVSDTHSVTVTGAFVADSLVVGMHNGCGLRGGQAYCWGSNTGAQLAFTGASTSNVPRLIPGHSFATLTAGSSSRPGQSNSHMCGIEADGDAFCWGTNDTGQLGFNDGPRDAFEFPAGSTYCRLGAESAVICYPTPMMVAGGGWMQVDAGDDHTCAITTSGAAYCWGLSSTGQLGGTATPETCYRFQGGGFNPYPCVLTPKPVAPPLTFRQVSAGDAYTCGLAAGGTVYCWGLNNLGQLGNGTTAPATAPTAAGGGTYARVSAGRRHTCAVTAGGTIRCWGDNAAGQLGTGAAGGSSTTPVTVPAPGDGSVWSTVSAGDNQTCAVATSGRAYCWGANAAGQLGDGTTTPRTTPTPVQTARLFTDVGAGTSFSCGRSTTGVVFCWGTNFSGRLGDGDTASSRRTIPGPVRAP
jgi:alpha-tubulin suppressor-like RCC1 family protein